MKIDYPEDKGRVSFAETIKGSGLYQAQGRQAMVVVFSLMANRYYPQESAVDVEQDGKWSSLAYFGERDKGEVDRFDVLVVMLDSHAKNVIEEYVVRAKSTGEWPGLEKLPKGAEIYDRISVVRVR